MVDVRPFRGLRFGAALSSHLGDLICPPYDVISPTDQVDFHARHPRNIVRLELGETFASDSEGDNRYTRAAATLAQWREDGTLAEDLRPGFYLHLARFVHDGRTHERRELLAVVRLADWKEGLVLPHERTLAQPKADRLQLLRATATNLSPVFALYPGQSEAMDAVWRQALASRPEARFSDWEGAEHRLWVCQQPELLDAARQDLQRCTLFIADGHHRYETALQFRDEVRGAPGPIEPEAESEWVLMALVAASDPGLLILPIHRLFQSRPSLDPEALLSSLFELERISVEPKGLAWAPALQERLQATGRSRRAFGLYGPRPDVFTLATLRSEPALQASLPAERSQAWRDLDVAVVEQLLMQPLLAASARTLEEAVTYTRDFHEACLAVQQGAAYLAVLMNPTQVHQVLAVARAGDRMPQKSTYFYPKTPTGLVMHILR